MRCSRCGTIAIDVPGIHVCALCGHPLNSGDAGTFSGPVPWESKAADRNPIKTIAFSLIRSFSMPSRFFAAIAANQSLKPAVIYALILGSIGTLGSLLWELVFPISLSQILGEDSFSPAALVAAPVIVVAQVFFLSLVLHAMLIMTGSKRKRWSVTFKTACYAQGSAIFQLVPFIGMLLSAVAWFYLIISGLHAAHGISKLRGFAIVTLPLLVLLILAAFAAVFFIIVYGLTSGPQTDLSSLFRK